MCIFCGILVVLENHRSSGGGGGEFAKCLVGEVVRNLGPEHKSTGRISQIASLSQQKKKKRRRAGKKDAVSVSGFQKNPRSCGKHFADRNVAGKPVSCGWLYLPITRCTVIVVHWWSLPHSLTSCQRNAWLWLFTSCLCHIPLPL